MLINKIADFPFMLNTLQFSAYCYYNLIIIIVTCFKADNIIQATGVKCERPKIKFVKYFDIYI